jgi:hypothetical protein
MLSTINFNAFAETTGLFQKVEFNSYPHEDTFNEEAPLIYKVVAATSLTLALSMIYNSVRYLYLAERPGRSILRVINLEKNLSSIYLEKSVSSLFSSFTALLCFSIARKSNAPYFNNKITYIARDITMLASLAYSFKLFFSKKSFYHAKPKENTDNSSRTLCKTHGSRTTCIPLSY